jgi:hypothetical protein
VLGKKKSNKLIQRRIVEPINYGERLSGDR